MPAKTDKIYLPYAEARPYIMDADVLLYDGHSPLARAIKAMGRNAYSHAALAGWSNGDDHASEYARLFAYEMKLTGGAGTHLSAHAEKWPGRIDVYRVSDLHTVYDWDPTSQQQTGRPEILDRRLAVALMKDFCRPGEYGYLHLLKSALLHAPVLRFLMSQPTDDQLEDRSCPPYCSEAIAYVLRKAFTDVVINTPDHYTEPGDLAKSPLLHYMFTLVAPTQE